MTTRPVPLPTRRSKTAPRFDVDEPLSLWDYLVDYEVLAEAAQLDEARKIQYSIIYLDRNEVEFWKCLNAYAGSDWEIFKNAVLERYPGSIPSERWTLDDFSALCNAQKTKSIQTRGDFAKFDRMFSTISSSLISKELVSDLEAKKLYWNSLDTDFRHQVVERVKLSKPAYTSRMILTIAEIWDAASLVLDGTLAETSSVALQNATLATPTPSFEPVKEEPFSMDRFAQQMATMMAQTVEKAITKAFEQVTSMYTPSVQTNADQNSSGAFYSARVDERIPVYPRNEPWVQKVDDYRVPDTAAVALKTDTIGTSTKLVKSRSISSVEAHVESKRDRNAYIAALQWKNSQRGGEDDDEDLEDLILGLEVRVEKPKKTEEDAYQGPQEEQVAPRIPARAIVPPKSAPGPVPPIFEVADQPYPVQINREDITEPVEISDHVLSQTVTLSVEDLLTLCPGVRKHLEEVVETQQIVTESLKKNLEKEETTPCRTALLVEEKLRLGAVVMRPSHSEGADMTLSKPDEKPAEESVAKEEVITEMTDLKKNNEEILREEELSARRVDYELFEEEYRPLVFSRAYEPPKNERSSMYSHSHPVASLHVLSSMDLSSPPVSACRSVTANHCRFVFVESSIVRADQEDPEMKKSRPQAVKKTKRLLYDPGGGGLVQNRTSRIAIPACPHPAKLPNAEQLVFVHNLRGMLQSKSLSGLLTRARGRGS